MSVKTDSLTALLPDAYGATDSESLLYRLLDAMGAELMVADDKVKRLLKSHWVDYAEGAALDGLGAIYDVGRRLQPNGDPEGDDAFRRRLRAVVPLFTGGGTVRAIRGAVQSVLGLPFDLGAAGLPDALRDDLERLVVLREFPTTDEEVEYGPERIVVENVPGVGDQGVIYVDSVARSAAAVAPRIVWTVVVGSAVGLSLERLGSTPRAGLQSKPDFVMPAGSLLTLESTASGALRAVLGGVDVSAQFEGLDGGTARLPVVPYEPTRWRFGASGARFDLPATRFDTAQFDLPRFAISVKWTRPQPLTFDIDVPWSAREAIEAIRRRHGYAKDVLAFSGLGRDAVMQAVQQSRAAGVRANLAFYVFATEDHNASDSLSVGEQPITEDAAAGERLRLEGAARAMESHGASESSYGYAGELDVATFDGPFVFT